METGFPKSTVKQQLNSCYYDEGLVGVDFRQCGKATVVNLRDLVRLELGGGPQATDNLPDFDPEDDASRRSKAEAMTKKGDFIFNKNMCASEIVLLCESDLGMPIEEIPKGEDNEEETEKPETKGATSENEGGSDSDE